MKKKTCVVNKYAYLKAVFLLKNNIIKIYLCRLFFISEKFIFLVNVSLVTLEKQNELFECY